MTSTFKYLSNTKNWLNQKEKAGVLQTAVLKNQFGKDYTAIIEGQGLERVAVLYFWQNSEVSHQAFHDENFWTLKTAEIFPAV